MSKWFRLNESLVDLLYFYPLALAEDFVLQRRYCLLLVVLVDRLDPKIVHSHSIQYSNNIQ